MSENTPSERRLTDEQVGRLYEYRGAFSLDLNDKRLAEEQYSDGHSSSRGRPMHRRNRSVKNAKQWRTSGPERSVLRYTTG